MGLKLNATNGGGSVELDVPNTVNSEFALTVSAAAGTIDRLQRAGNIVQVSHGVTTTKVNVTNSGSTWIDTGVTTTLTSQFANSHFIVIGNLYAYWRDSEGTNTDFAGGGYRIDRNGTALMDAPRDGNGNFSEFHQAGGASNLDVGTRSTLVRRDSPNVAAGTSLTYKIQIQNYASTGGTAEFSRDGAESTIIVMEVAP